MSIKYRTLFWILTAVLALSLLPLLVIAGYNAPSADDYSYGLVTHAKFMETGSILQTAAEAARQAKNIYQIWQGTFSATFLMMLQPAVFGEEYYFLGTVVLLGTFTTGIFLLSVSLFSGIFGQKKSVSGIIAAAVSLLCIQTLPSAVQGFFWYNGAVYYTFFYSVSLFAAALCIRAVKGSAHRGGRCAALCVLAFILGGGNYVTALSCTIIIVSTIALLLLLKNKNVRYLILPAVVLLVSFAISVAAPGNAVRQSEAEHVPDVIGAILASFGFGAKYCVKWFRLPLVGVLLFLTPIFWKTARSGAFRFRYPLALSAFSFCLLSAMFCPTAYALGIEGDLRLLNIIYYAYILLVILNCFYWAGWLSAVCGRTSEAGHDMPLGTAAAAVLACLICCGIFMVNSGYTSLAALGSLSSGEAREYRDCNRRRCEILHDTDILFAELEPLPCQPYVLYFDDITEDADDWRNQGMRKFYGKISVAVRADS